MFIFPSDFLSCVLCTAHDVGVTDPLSFKDVLTVADKSVETLNRSGFKIDGRITKEFLQATSTNYSAYFLYDSKADTFSIASLKATKDLIDRFIIEPKDRPIFDVIKKVASKYFRPKLNIERFIENNPDWEEKLSGEPYYITTKTDGDYFLLKYNQLNSDFSNSIVKECRGIIFHRTDGLVCYPFSKFYNYGEQNAAEIDWKTAVISEKIDGCLMKIWFHNNKWHLSTNNSVDAFKAVFSDDGLSFGIVFVKALCGEKYQKLIGDPERTEQIFSQWCEKNLKPENTYMFELVSPETRVVIGYTEAKIYHLATRNMNTLKEIDEEVECQRPVRYILHTLDDVIKMANAFDKNHEGFVVCDGNYNRIKVKGEQYLTAHHLANNGVITTKRILKMWREETLDDFLAYAPQYSDKVNSVLDAIHSYEKNMDDEYDRVYKEGMTRQQIYEAANPRYAGYCASKFSGKYRNASEYTNTMLLSTLRRALG